MGLLNVNVGHASIRICQLKWHGNDTCSFTIEFVLIVGCICIGVDNAFSAFFFSMSSFFLWIYHKHHRIECRSSYDGQQDYEYHIVHIL